MSRAPLLAAEFCMAAVDVTDCVIGALHTHTGSQIEAEAEAVEEAATVKADGGAAAAANKTVLIWIVLLERVRW